MKVLVTGGAGFLGNAVVQALDREGHEVRILDIVEQTGPVRGERYVGSILDPNAVSRALQGMDAVVHLAAMLGVRKTEDRRLECLDVNIQGTVNVLDGCVKNRVDNFVFASSSEVYGDALEIPIRETTPTQPLSVYGVSKLAGEQYVSSYARRYGLKFAIARLFNCYGEGQVAEFVLPRFVLACRNGDGPTVYGTGEQVRCFCHVEDTSRGIVRLLCSLKPDAGSVSGQTFNIGNPEQPITMRALAELTVRIAAELGAAPPPIHMVPFSRSDRDSGREITRRIPDVEKARRTFGFKPAISLREGIRRMFHTPIPESWWEPLRGERSGRKAGTGRGAVTMPERTAPAPERD